MTTAQRRSAARELGAAFDGVLSRRRLRTVGVDARMIRREVQADRWRTHGQQTVALHTSELSTVAKCWRAIWEVGEDIAVLDGISALKIAGLKGYSDDLIHVSVRHSHDVVPVSGVRIHKVIRRRAGERVTTRLPRTRPEVAAIRAAHWSASDRQAALALCLPVQQRLASAEALRRARAEVRGRTRRQFINVVIADLVAGAHSLGELDFAAACRQRGLPEPERQTIRSGPQGRIYLDARWRNGLVVEINGAAHRWGMASGEDALRANAVTLSHDTVLRIELVGWRLAKEQYMDQVTAGFWLRETAVQDQLAA